MLFETRFREDRAGGRSRATARQNIRRVRGGRARRLPWIRGVRCPGPFSAFDFQTQGAPSLFWRRLGRVVRQAIPCGSRRESPLQPEDSTVHQAAGNRSRFGSVTSAAKKPIQRARAIAAVNRCATQKASPTKTEKASPPKPKPTCKKKPPAFRGRPSWGGTGSLLLLGLSRSWRGGGAGRSKLLQVILQETDFNATTGNALRLRFRIRGAAGNWCVAHADEVNAIDRNVMVEDEIADHRLGHLLRVGDCDLSVA